MRSHAGLNLESSMLSTGISSVLSRRIHGVPRELDSTRHSAKPCRVIRAQSRPRLPSPEESTHKRYDCSLVVLVSDPMDSHLGAKILEYVCVRLILRPKKQPKAKSSGTRTMP
jgi:hypothetical protein